MSLYHSQWCMCILFEKMHIPQLCLLSKWCQHEPQGHKKFLSPVEKRNAIPYNDNLAMVCTKIKKFQC